MFSMYPICDVTVLVAPGRVDVKINIVTVPAYKIY